MFEKWSVPYSYLKVVAVVARQQNKITFSTLISFSVAFIYYSYWHRFEIPDGT